MYENCMKFGLGKIWAIRIISTLSQSCAIRLQRGNLPKFGWPGADAYKTGHAYKTDAHRLKGTNVFFWQDSPEVISLWIGTLKLLLQANLDSLIGELEIKNVQIQNLNTESYNMIRILTKFRILVASPCLWICRSWWRARRRWPQRWWNRTRGSSSPTKYPSTHLC